MMAGVSNAPAAADLLAVALEVALEAGALLLDGQRRDRVVAGTKSSVTDMVTEVDQAAEALVEARLAQLRPGDGLVGEEGAATESTTGVVWVVDPIDGTTNYVYGYPAFCVSVAAELHGEPVAAVVHDPQRADTFLACRGGGAFLRNVLGERRLELPGSGGPLAESLVGTGFGYAAERRLAQGAILAGVLGRVRDIRRGGSAALDLCSVAAGRLDAFYERGLNHWDHAAGALIAREAGASVTTLEGGPLSPDRTVVAARPDLLEPLLALLREAGAGGPVA